MSSLPEEIYLEILLRVPVKSTFVCRCVCKSWFKLISDSVFAKMHLDLTTQRNNCSLLVKTDTLVKSDKAYRLCSGNHPDDAVVVQLETPYKYLRNGSTTLLGSFNGLVYGWINQFKLYFLWNPATKEYMRLPKPQSQRGVTHGFGYDYKNDNYKLVIIDRRGEKKSTYFEVYSLKLNSWKYFQSIKHECHNFHYSKQSGALLNGSLHWLVSIGKASSIVLMDISEEGFAELQLPVILPTQHYVNIGVLEESLSVLVRNKETFEVWVMRDYGVPNSWTKLYTNTYESIMCYSHCCNMELIGSFKNGEILFSEGGTVFFYDPKYGTARVLVIDTLYGGRAVKHFESLVSLNSIIAVGRRKKRESTRNLEDSMTKKINRSVPKPRGG